MFTLLNASLTELVAQHSGSISSGSYTGIDIDWISYDETQKVLILHKKGAGADTVIPFSGIGNVKVWVFNNVVGYLDGFNPFTMEKVRACSSQGNGSLSYGDLSITWSNCNATSNKRLLYFGPEAQGSNTPVIKTIQPNVASHLYGYYQGLACAFIVLDPITVN